MPDTVLREYTIQLASWSHIPFLPEIERAAARLFPADLLPPHVRGEVLPEAVLASAQAEGRLWVALASDGHPVGFALATVVGGAAFLAEVDVHPEHGRKGLGRALINGVVGWARTRGFGALELTTFEHLRWNAPFYERLGFRRLGSSELSPELAGVLDAEIARGLRGRVAMRLDLRATG